MACETFDLRIPVLTPAQIGCAACAERVCSAVRAVPGVESAECMPNAATVRVCWDPETVDVDAVEEALRTAAHGAHTGFGHAAYRITGLD